MTSPHPRLGVDDLARHIDEAVFGERYDEKVGLELEWLTQTETGQRPSIDQLEDLVAAAAPRLPRGGLLTIEPGGQLELSSHPFAGPADACEAAATDLLVLECACRAEGIDLIALGADPVRAPQLLRAEAPRYAAMQAYFERRWPAALQMMTNTASIQLNLGYGHDEKALRERWHLIHAVGPTLVAAFANSPFSGGDVTGWHSSRWHEWIRIDPTRTRPLALDCDPRDAWLDYALDANVMLIRLDADDHRAVCEPFPFGRWLHEGHELGWPTFDDFTYHLTTLFPTVRPRGWFEVRYLDALPTPFWHVAVSVLATLLDHDDIRPAARAAVAGTEHLWSEAAQLALGHPALAAAAQRLFALVLDALGTAPDDGASHAIVSTYHKHWIARGRCPADDRLDHFRRTGELVPRAESPVPYAAFEAVTP